MRVQLNTIPRDQEETRAGGPFNPNVFVQKLAAFVRGNPAVAATAYAKAAERLRQESHRPENKKAWLNLQMLAAKVDQLASEALIPKTDAESGEVISLFRDDTTSSAPTDYDAFVDRNVAAQTGSSGSPNAELEAAWLKTELERRERAKEHELGGHTTPSSAVPGRTMFSNSIIVQYGGSPNQGVAGRFGGGTIPTVQEGSVCRWDGNEEDTQCIAVSIYPGVNVQGASFPTAKDPNGNSYNYRPFFHAYWGTGRGQPTEVIGDVGRGIQFSVAACFLTVNVGMDPPATIAGGGTQVPGSMMVTGTIGFNPAGTTAAIIRTRYIDNLAIGATKNAIIPSFSTTLLPLMRSDISGASSVTLNFKDANGTIQYSFSLSGSALQSQPLPITGDIYSIDVINNGAANASFHLCFTLSL